MYECFLLFFFLWEKKRLAIFLMLFFFLFDKDHFARQDIENQHKIMALKIEELQQENR